MTVAINDDITAASGELQGQLFLSLPVSWYYLRGKIEAGLYDAVARGAKATCGSTKAAGASAPLASMTLKWQQ